MKSELDFDKKEFRYENKFVVPYLDKSEVEKVILRALSKQPVDRFSSAGEMAEALEVAWSAASDGKPDQQESFTPVLPVGVPPIAEVPNITLPNTAAIAPVPAAAAPAETLIQRRVTRTMRRLHLRLACASRTELAG